MKRVLIFGMTETPGGVESFLMNYYRNIDKTKLQFDFLCNSYNKIAYEDEIKSLGGRTFHITARSADYFKYRKEIKAFFENHASEYSVIWVNVCSLANIDYLIYAKKYHIKHRIIHSHNSQNMDSKLRGILHEINKKRIASIATHFWACSADAAAWFYPEKLKNRVHIIHNAINVDRVLYNPEGRKSCRQLMQWDDAYIIGNVGRLHFQKNQTFLIDIFSEIVKKDKQARLLLIGQGDDEEMLRKKVERLDLSEYVYFAGVQSNIGDWLSSMDIFVFPSLFEGLSLAALEVQANGLPVIASEGVIPASVKVNDNFFFYSLEKSADEWAEQIASVKKASSRMKDSVEIKRRFKEIGFDIAEEYQRLEGELLKLC